MKEKKHPQLRAYLKRDRLELLRSHWFWGRVALWIAAIPAFFVACFVIEPVPILGLAIFGALGYLAQASLSRAKSHNEETVGEIRYLLRKNELEAALSPDVAREVDRCAGNALRMIEFFEGGDEGPTPEERRQGPAAVRAEMDTLFQLVRPAVVSGISPTMKSVAEIFQVGDSLDEMGAAIESYRSMKPQERESKMLFETLREIRLRDGKA